MQDPNSEKPMQFHAKQFFPGREPVKSLIGRTLSKKEVLRNARFNAGSSWRGHFCPQRPASPSGVLARYSCRRRHRLTQTEQTHPRQPAPRHPRSVQKPNIQHRDLRRTHLAASRFQIRFQVAANPPRPAPANPPSPLSMSPLPGFHIQGSNFQQPPLTPIPQNQYSGLTPFSHSPMPSFH